MTLIVLPDLYRLNADQREALLCLRELGLIASPVRVFRAGGGRVVVRDRAGEVVVLDRDGSVNRNPMEVSDG